MYKLIERIQLISSMLDCNIEATDDPINYNSLVRDLSVENFDLIVFFDMYSKKHVTAELRGLLVQLISGDLECLDIGADFP